MTDDTRTTPDPRSPGRRRLLQSMGLAGVAAGTAGLWPSWIRASEGEPRHGGTLRVALPMADTIDPLRMSSGGGIAIVQQVGEYLVWAEEDLSLRPVLATDWRAEDGGRRWIFELRRDVRFHNGREMTAEDVVASFRRMVEPDQPSSAAAQLSFLSPEGVTAAGRYTVRFDLDRPIGAFPYYTHIYNAVILPADYEGDFADNPVGTGPFRLVRYRPQEGAILERNEDYWDAPRPYLDRVELDLYDGSQPQVLAIQGGEADVMLTAGYIDARPLFDDDDINVLAASTAQHRQLAMRADQPPFEDARVRRAVALALDRPAMVDALLGGKASLGNDHPVAPVYPEVLDLRQRERSLERAKRLLSDAGFGNGFPIELHIGRLAELPEYGVLAQQMLGEIGIDVRLQVEPLNVYYGHWTEVQFGLTDWVSRPTADQILSVAFTSDAEWNASHWRSREFDRLVREFQAEPVQRERSRLATRLGAILNDQVPTAITYFNDGLRPMRRHVRGLPGNMSNYLDLTRTWLA